MVLKVWRRAIIGSFGLRTIRPKKWDSSEVELVRLLSGLQIFHNCKTSWAQVFVQPLRSWTTLHHMGPAMTLYVLHTEKHLTDLYHSTVQHRRLDERQ